MRLFRGCWLHRLRASRHRTYCACLLFVFLDTRRLPQSETRTKITVSTNTATGTSPTSWIALLLPLGSRITLGAGAAL